MSKLTLQLKPKQSVWVVSDTHFGHTNIISHSNRPFGSVEEMDAVLIQNWTGVVKKSDIVFFLGDFSLRDPSLYTGLLTGEIYFILGNHDERKRLEKTGRFKEFYDLLELTLLRGTEKKMFVLCHYPLVSWNKAHYGVIHHYGHTHSNRDDIPGKRISVCVENTNYTPVKLGET